MNRETERKNDEKNIFVNKQKYHVDKDSLTGRQILALANLDADQYDLFLVHGQKNEKIEPDQVVSIKNEPHINAILKSVPYG